MRRGGERVDLKLNLAGFLFPKEGVGNERVVLKKLVVSQRHARFGGVEKLERGCKWG
jgi:hypothetical protein